MIRPVMSHRETNLVDQPKMHLTRRANHGQQHAKRNEGVISLVLAEVRRKLTEAVETDDFHGKVSFEVDVVNQELTMLHTMPCQRLKLK